MPDVRQTGVSPADLNKQLGYRALEESYKSGRNLTLWLEKQDPTSKYEKGSREAELDAFERQLAHIGVRTQSNAEMGYRADQLRAFEEKGGEAGSALMIEYLARQYRKIAHAGTRSIIASDANTVGSAMRPYVDAAQARATQMQPAIPLSELIAFTTRIDNDTYRALYLNDDEQEYRMVRVGQAGEVPSASLTQGEKTVDLFKFGRRLDITYEALRRVPIDTVAFYIARMAVQAEVDKVSKVLDVIVNGDGNDGTEAEVVNITDIDPAATNDQLTLAGWLGFKLKFKNPYQLTHELVQEGIALQQMLLDTGSSNTMLRDLSGTFGGFEPMNQSFRDNVRFGVLDEAPAGQIVAIDGRYAIEQITEIGGTINETKRWVESQVESLVFTEIEGYAVVDNKAAKILDLTQ